MFAKTESAVKGWVPVKLHAQENNLCRWLYVGNKDFTEPFFDETILSCSMLPENGHPQKSMSSTDVLADWVKAMDVVEPTAFIFHISRCGSTLISQMLGLQPANIILSVLHLSFSIYTLASSGILTILTYFNFCDPYFNHFGKLSIWQK